MAPTLGDQTSNTNIERINKLQKRAALIILKLISLLHQQICINALCGWLSIVVLIIISQS